MNEPRSDHQIVTLGAVGDVCLSNTCGAQIQTHGWAWPFERALPALQEADLLFGNMESVVLPPEYPEDMIDPQGLVTKFDGTKALELAGFDFMNMAANHVLDGGEVGMFHTRDCLEARGIATAGVGRTQEEARRLRVLERKGLTFGFLCYCKDNLYTLGIRGPCHAYYDPEVVLSDIVMHRDAVDVLVVSVHADLEHAETPSPHRREAFRSFARAGAKVVLGHHPHVPQGVEQLDDSLLVYSLGNFYFFPHIMPWHRRKRPRTAQTFVLLAEVSRRGVCSFRRVPCQIQIPPEMRPIPLEGASAAGLLRAFRELDRACHDDTVIRRNWRAAALRNIESSLMSLETYRRPPKGLRGRTLRLLTRVLGEKPVRPNLEEVFRRWLIQLVLVPENQMWWQEVVAEARERWQTLASDADLHHRPSYRLRSTYGDSGKGTPG